MRYAPTWTAIFHVLSPLPGQRLQGIVIVAVDSMTALAEDLRQNPLPPLERELIFVQSQGVGRREAWTKVQ